MYWLEESSLDEHPELWEIFLVHLTEVVAAFANYEGSRYNRYDRKEIYEMITSAEARETYLKKGLIVPSDVLPAESSRQFWLIAPGEKAFKMPECLEKGIITVGWQELSDVFSYESRDQLKEVIRDAKPEINPEISSQMIWKFAYEIKRGDIIIAKKGLREVAGWSVVTGDYQFHGDRENYRHLRTVEWRSSVIVSLENTAQFPQNTVTEKTMDAELLQAMANAYSGFPFNAPLPPPIMEIYKMEHVLAEVFIEQPPLETMLRRLREKKNIILQGAPGVGKTFIARRLAHLHLGRKDDATIEMVQFHQSYSYEDFVQGIKPSLEGGHFEVKDGIFHRLCRRAASDLANPYFLIIDEVNRGNLSKIFGELMMLIETDKRGHKLTLTYSDEPFSVPSNLHLIGTMNTADRSLSMVDYALRRRFSFLTLDPGFHTKSFSSFLVGKGISLAQVEVICGRMQHLNEQIADDRNLGNGYRIGHSFFTPMKNVPDVAQWYGDIIEHEILPLLEEYWMDDADAVKLHRGKLLPPLG